MAAQTQVLWSSHSTAVGNYAYALAVRVPMARPPQLAMIPEVKWWAFAKALDQIANTVTASYIAGFVGVWISVAVFRSGWGAGWGIILLLGSVCLFGVAMSVKSGIAQHVAVLNAGLEGVQISYVLQRAHRNASGFMVRGATHLVAMGMPVSIMSNTDAFWESSIDPQTERTIYFNTATRETSWTPPQAMVNKAWQTSVDQATEKVIYFNTVTRETSWTPPPALVLAAWQVSVDPQTGRTVYSNTITRETSWNPPPGYIVSVVPAPMQTIAQPFAPPLAPIVVPTATAAYVTASPVHDNTGKEVSSQEPLPAYCSEEPASASAPPPPPAYPVYDNNRIEKRVQPDPYGLDL